MEDNTQVQRGWAKSIHPASLQHGLNSRYKSHVHLASLQHGLNSPRYKSHVTKFTREFFSTSLEL